MVEPGLKMVWLLKKPSYCCWIWGATLMDVSQICVGIQSPVGISLFVDWVRLQRNLCFGYLGGPEIVLKHVCGSDLGHLSVLIPNLPSDLLVLKRNLCCFGSGDPQILQTLKNGSSVTGS